MTDTTDILSSYARTVALDHIVEWESLPLDQRRTYLRDLVQRITDDNAREERERYESLAERLNARVADVERREERVKRLEGQYRSWWRWRRGLIRDQKRALDDRETEIASREVELEQEMSLVRIDATIEALGLTAGGVYYFQRATDDAVKIGTATKVYHRRKGLEKEFGPLVLRAVEPGGYRLEHRRHVEFDVDRIDRSGEWFRPSAALVTHMDAVRLQHPTFHALVENGLA